jgi:uncharacterized protein (UPF0335 family)
LVHFSGESRHFSLCFYRIAVQFGRDDDHVRDAANPLEAARASAYSQPLNPESEERELAEGSIAADELRLLIERIERLEEEKKAIADDVRDVYGEAKARGYDPKTMRTVVRLRKMENHARQEAEALLDTYKAALGLA